MEATRSGHDRSYPGVADLQGRSAREVAARRIVRGMDADIKRDVDRMVISK
jgi:hypothetical protein